MELAICRPKLASLEPSLFQVPGEAEVGEGVRPEHVLGKRRTPSIPTSVDRRRLAVGQVAVVASAVPTLLDAAGGDACATASLGKDLVPSSRGVSVTPYVRVRRWSPPSSERSYIPPIADQERQGTPEHAAAPA